MWDTVQTNELHLSRDLPCAGCGHAAHTYLPCSDTCACLRTTMPGASLRSQFVGSGVPSSSRTMAPRRSLTSAIA